MLYVPSSRRSSVLNAYEISVGVPPNRPAKKPTQTAPYSPAIKPAPDATPKARARGKDTIAAVTSAKDIATQVIKPDLIGNCHLIAE